ncbi:MAG: hypothetical protein ACTSQA_04510 [Candidatus Heimdallarchaeaceae archaeon]
MTNPYLKSYMAKQLMQLKSATGLQAFVTTVWAGVPIMVTWNVLASEIMQIWDDEVVDDEDIPFLSDIIKDFLQGELEI